MTRDEAALAIHRVHHPEDFAGSGEPPEPAEIARAQRNRAWYERTVDGYIRLGILKVEQPKSKRDRFIEEMRSRDWHSNSLVMHESLEAFDAVFPEYK